MKKSLIIVTICWLTMGLRAQTEASKTLSGETTVAPVGAISFPVSGGEATAVDTADGDSVATMSTGEGLVADSLLATDEPANADSLLVTDEPVCADSLPYPENLRQRLDALLQSRLLQRTQLGLMVWDLTADSCVYRYQERQTLRPASTMKLLTAITAIDRLGGDYQLRTRLCYTGTISNGTLNGTLYCVGGMDPMFTTDDLTAFVESLRRQGVDTIRGRIVADRSFKEPELLGEGWCWDDDNPTLSPLLVDKKADFISVFTAKLKRAGITVVGNASKRSEVGNASMRSVVGNASQRSAQLIALRCHSLSEVLLTMMKESDNLFAESVFYNVEATSGNLPARATDATRQERALIERCGLDASPYRLADGSGLSLYNYLSAELEVALLRYAYQHEDIYNTLIPSLPIAGSDGTLKKRMKGTPAENNVQAKTGTLTGVIALAGYLTAANGHRLCFSIINQGTLKASEARDFQDKVCTILCEP